MRSAARYTEGKVQGPDQQPAFEVLQRAAMEPLHEYGAVQQPLHTEDGAEEPLHSEVLSALIMLYPSSVDVHQLRTVLRRCFASFTRTL